MSRPHSCSSRAPEPKEPDRRRVLQLDCLHALPRPCRTCHLQLVLSTQEASAPLTGPASATLTQLSAPSLWWQFGPPLLHTSPSPFHPDLLSILPPRSSLCKPPQILHCRRPPSAWQLVHVCVSLAPLWEPLALQLVLLDQIATQGPKRGPPATRGVPRIPEGWPRPHSLLADSNPPQGSLHHCRVSRTRMATCAPRLGTATTRLITFLGRQGYLVQAPFLPSSAPPNISLYTHFFYCLISGDRNVSVLLRKNSLLPHSPSHRLQNTHQYLLSL